MFFIDNINKLTSWLKNFHEFFSILNFILNLVFIKLYMIQKYILIFEKKKNNKKS